MKKNIETCYNCARHCVCNKIDKLGFCGVTNDIKISKVMLHNWEEPCISFKNGSGAIFFAGCNLKCVYCQNYEISYTIQGKSYSIRELVQLFKQLEEVGADNINLVTPTPYADKILQALRIYKPRIPVVYNCSGYEDAEFLKQFDGLIDIFLIDCKYFSNKISKEYSNANNYFEVFKNVLLEMKKQQQLLQFDQDGQLIKGVIIRHLVLPNNTNDSIEIAKWLDDNIDNNVIISLMSQYTPCHKALKIPALSRKIKALEYKRVTGFYKNNTKFTNIYVQNLQSANISYIPDFKD